VGSLHAQLDEFEHAALYAPAMRVSGEDGPEPPGDRGVHFFDNAPEVQSPSDQASKICLTVPLTCGALRSSVRRPKWRLCFRMDRDALSKEARNDASSKQQRDFFVTVVDPPAVSSTLPPPPFFASELACQAANLLVGRPFLAKMPSGSFEGRSVAVLGRDCVTAGLVAAMLGGRVAFVCERALFPHVQHNVRMFLRDASDYTNTKTIALCATNASRPGGLDPTALCDGLNVAPPLDVLVLTSSAAGSICNEVFGPMDDCTDLDRLFEVIEAIVPNKAATRVLLVDDNATVLSANTFLAAAAENVMGDGPADVSQQWHAAENMLGDVAFGWSARPFCCLLKQVAVIWLERRDAPSGSRVFRGQQSAPMCRHLPPMGADSNRSGCGGDPQMIFLNGHAANPEQHENHSRLCEALMTHNRWKFGEAAQVLEEARAWASVASRPTRTKNTRQGGGMRRLLHKGDGSAPATARRVHKVSSVGPLRTDQLDEDGAGHGQLLRASTAPDEAKVAGSEVQLPPHATTAPVPTRPKQDRGGAMRPISHRSVQRSAGQTIAERHASPPHWYRCNRQVYGSAKTPPESAMTLAMQTI